MKKQLHKAEEAHQAALAKFSPEAKEADAKLTAITTDPNLTAQEKHQKIGKLMNELPAKVRDEIIKAMKGN